MATETTCFPNPCFENRETVTSNNALEISPRTFSWWTTQFTALKPSHNARSEFRPAARQALGMGVSHSSPYNLDGSCFDQVDLAYQPSVGLP